MVEIFTDGSAVANSKSKNFLKGGMGVAFYVDGELKKTVSKGYYPTKTGRMELKALMTALQMLSKDQKAMIYSDSMYVINMFNKGWLRSWEREGWPDRIKNKDLLIPILQEYRKFPPRSLIFQHIKGHQNNSNGNDIADLLASYSNFKVFEKDL